VPEKYVKKALGENLPIRPVQRRVKPEKKQCKTLPTAALFMFFPLNAMPRAV
jgi:hypothetical protein